MSNYHLFKVIAVLDILSNSVLLIEYIHFFFISLNISLVDLLSSMILASIILYPYCRQISTNKKVTKMVTYNKMLYKWKWLKTQCLQVCCTTLYGGLLMKLNWWLSIKERSFFFSHKLARRYGQINSKISLSWLLVNYQVVWSQL